MEQKLREIFNLEWIEEFAEKNISNTEWIEEDDDGEKRKILVIDTLFDGGHGAYIPGMVLELFGQADRYDLEDPYNPENETIYDALMYLEDEVNQCLNRLLSSKGTYYIGYHEADGSYCLFYEEHESENNAVLVVILETTEDHTEPIRKFEMTVPANDTELAVRQAIEEVKRMGYKVILNSDGGCCEYVSSSFDEDYIAVTVEPENLISAE